MTDPNDKSDEAFEADNKWLREQERVVANARSDLRIAEAVLRRKTRAFDAKWFPDCLSMKPLDLPADKPWHRVKI